MDIAIEPVNVDKVTEENPQSRFRVTDNANLAPGVCAVCGSAGGDGRQFIDFSKTMDFYGVFYFCTFCVAEAAQLLGLGNLERLNEDLDRYAEVIRQRGTENAELQENLNAARILLRSCTCDPDSTNPTVLDSLETDSEPEPDDPTTDEPIGLEGFDDLPSFGSDDESEKPKRRRSNSSS